MDLTADNALPDINDAGSVSPTTHEPALDPALSACEILILTASASPRSSSDAGHVAW